ncbi:MULTISPECIES: ABC transporter ATP-binding protein [Prochlorococcus]|uniref:ABC transporter ATP-binding protein n=1 Tax=Prochlorococcus TaxID=1218 RepID=UPI0007B3DF88|nr:MULTISPECIES: ABC transporter ATP-binding protein [Prochlorococcus]KZR66186.1 Teichoic acids export ATP-binding protein TagH [Prochlorococcus marinus str. MIT 1312]KZR83018.1 Teichoic acids export ATP-binding protein TagH [Prochlorococcus marinus str. MIT 1327]
MNDRIAIRADGLSKCYHIYDHPRDRLIQAIWGRDRFGRSKLRYREFWALNNVSFELARGQTLGVVGRNGSGKSTLLQLLCGTLRPTKGSVNASGRIGALLELGSGFNPEFSGLDNVYLNAALLGLSHAEVEKQLDAILSFADIGEFIHQPVKTYSSGMALRLAFAVQAHINPDVLVVDEALAVGDELFQKKCYSHLERLKEKGTAVLLVTHSCPQIIQHCDQALLLHSGRLRMIESPAKVTTTYQRLMNESDKAWDRYFSDINSTKDLNNQHIPECSSDQGAKPQKAWMDHMLKPKSPETYTPKGGSIVDAWITLEEALTNKTSQVNNIAFGKSFKINFEYLAEIDLENVAMACNIASVNGQRLSGQCHPKQAGLTNRSEAVTTFQAGSRWITQFHFNGGLWPGLYFISGGLLSYRSGEREFIHRAIDFRALRILEGEPMHRIGNCALAKGNPKIINLIEAETP